ncbi:hypothetical protein V8C26DRAFT_291066 [Trichoderma gracile]
MRRRRQLLSASDWAPFRVNANARAVSRTWNRTETRPGAWTQMPTRKATRHLDTTDRNLPSDANRTSCLFASSPRTRSTQVFQHELNKQEKKHIKPQKNNTYTTHQLTHHSHHRAHNSDHSPPQLHSFHNDTFHTPALLQVLPSNNNNHCPSQSEAASLIHHPFRSSPVLSYNCPSYLSFTIPREGGDTGVDLDIPSSTHTSYYILYHLMHAQQRTIDNRCKACFLFFHFLF